MTSNLPTQDSLDELLDQVTVVRVIESGVHAGTAMGSNILGETSEADSIRALKQSLQIEPANGHCMCFGDYALQLYSGSVLSATIGYHHGTSIRWSAWNDDAMLKNPEQVIDWFTNLGIDGPAIEFQDQQARNKKHMESISRWKEAMPPCLNAHIDEVMSDRFGEGPPSDELMQTLRTSYANIDDSILAVLKWYGSGEGAWSSYPSYESFPERILLSLPTQDILRAISARGLSGERLGGAARYFYGWGFNSSKGADQQLISYDLRVKLLNHMRESDDADVREGAKQALASMGPTRP